MAKKAADLASGRTDQKARTTAYNYFPTKESLYRGMLRVSVDAQRSPDTPRSGAIFSGWSPR